MQDRLIDSWTEDEVLKLHGDIVSTFMESDSGPGVLAAVEFAKYLKHRGLDNLNYTLFLDLLLHENEEVIIALLGDGVVFGQFNKLQRTEFLISACFELLKRFIPGKVFDLTLETLLNVFRQHYHNAAVGYKLYPLSIDEINYIGKYLDTTSSQSDKLNRIILDILSDLGELNSKDIKDHTIDRIGAHANKVRSAFLDKKAVLEEAIPAGIMARET